MIGKEQRERGVDPLQLWKTSIIRISGCQITSMFYGKSCQICVCNQVSDSLPFLEHQLKYIPMFFGRSNDSRTWLVQPAMYTGEGLVKGERMFKNARIGSYPNECGQNRPAETDRTTPGELSIPPYACLLVKWR